MPKIGALKNMYLNEVKIILALEVKYSIALILVLTIKLINNLALLKFAFWDLDKF